MPGEKRDGLAVDDNVAAREPDPCDTRSTEFRIWNRIRLSEVTTGIAPYRDFGATCINP